MADFAEKLVDELARAIVDDDAFNQYAYLTAGPAAEANALRRHNLCHYLRQMADQRPNLLLIGEAPGYRGCRLTGIPFTSEYIMLGGWPSPELFGPSSGFRKSLESPRIEREATATMVWQALATIRPLPLLWNAFPFHPHQGLQPRSNRPPRGVELAAGLPFIQAIVDNFAIATVVAVGQKAASSSERAGLPAASVRHPSHGGKSCFVNGLASLLDAIGQLD